MVCRKARHPGGLLPLVVVVASNQDSVVTVRRCTADDLSWRASIDHLATMGVKSLWKLLTPVGRPVLYFSLHHLYIPLLTYFPKPRNFGGKSPRNRFKHMDLPISGNDAR